MPTPGRRHLRTRTAAVLLTALLLPGTLASTADARTTDTSATDTHNATDRTLRPGIRGTVLAWGANSSGQLGDGTALGDRPTPDQVCGAAPCTDPLQDVIAVSAGYNHTVALRADGTVVTWGYNYAGQLGNATTFDSTTPVQVCASGATAPCGTFLTGVVAVAAGGDHSLALLANGTVVGWGSNGSGQLGNGESGTFATTPVQTCAYDGCARPLSNVAALAAGSNHSLAIGTDGYVRAWGNNSAGQLGNGESGTISTLPVAPLLDGGMVAVTGGQEHSAAVRRDGTVWTWGNNSSGQLGDGTTDQRSAPVQVCAVGATAPCATFLTGVTSVAAGYGHTVALRSDGTARSWGANFEGQLGDATTTSRTTPVRVCAAGTTAPCGTFQSGLVGIAAASGQTLALRSDGGVRGWGSNNSGVLGDGTGISRTTPVRTCAIGQTAPCGTPLGGAFAIAAASNHSVALVRS